MELVDMLNTKNVIAISDYIITYSISLQDIEYQANNIVHELDTIELKNLLLEVGSNIIGMYIESQGSEL